MDVGREQEDKIPYEGAILSASTGGKISRRDKNDVVTRSWRLFRWRIVAAPPRLEYSEDKAPNGRTLSSIGKQETIGERNHRIE